MIQAGMLNKDSEGTGLYGHLLYGKLLKWFNQKSNKNYLFFKNDPLEWLVKSG